MKLIRQQVTYYVLSSTDLLIVWNKEELPKQWKKSVIVPIYKKDEKSDCSNYRGILLLSTANKIVSDIILSRLNPYVDEIIADHQCGYRRNRLTTDEMFCTRQILENEWDYSGTGHQLLIILKYYSWE
jgi:hypothetical protein